MILMVVFAIGDFSCFVLLLLSPIILVCIVYLGEKRWSFGFGGIHIRFCGLRLQKVGKGLVQKEACGTCVHMVLSRHCINY
jgi:hypothetical protein